MSPALGSPATRTAAGWLIVASVLAWTPGAFSGYVLPKLLVVTVGLVLAAVSTRRAGPSGRLPGELVVVAALAALVFVVAALAGGTAEASLVGRWPRYEGLPTLLIYAGAAWAGARTTRAVELVPPVAVVSVLLALASVVQLLFGTARAGSLLGNATDQGAVAMMAVLVLAGPGLTERAPLALTGLLAGLVTVAASGSRTALALTVLGVVVLAVGSRRSAGALGVVVALGVLALGVPTTRGRLFDAATGHARLHQWRLTARLVADHPWLGVGPSRYVDTFGRYEDPAFVRFTGPRQIADSPHSVVLQVLVAGGGVLLAVVLIGLGLAVRRAVGAVRLEPGRAGPAVAVAAYVVLLGVNFTIAGPTCLAALLLGVVVAVPAGETPRRAERVMTGVVAVAAATAAVVVAAACVGDVRLRQGVDAAGAGRDATALALARLDSARSWRPWDSDVGMLGAQALAGAGAAGCVPLARWSLQHTRDNAVSLVAAGVCLAAQGRLGGALVDLDAAVEAAPQRPDGYVERAIVRYGRRDLAGARADLERAREIEPRSGVVRRLERRIPMAG